MSRPFHEGGHVPRGSPHGTIRATVKEKRAVPGKIKGHQVAAYPGAPYYLVVSDRSGAEAGHEPKALHKR